MKVNKKLLIATSILAPITLVTPIAVASTSCKGRVLNSTEKNKIAFTKTEFEKHLNDGLNEWLKTQPNGEHFKLNLYNPDNDKGWEITINKPNSFNEYFDYEFLTNNLLREYYSITTKKIDVVVRFRNEFETMRTTIEPNITLYWGIR